MKKTIILATLLLTTNVFAQSTASISAQCVADVKSHADKIIAQANSVLEFVKIEVEYQAEHESEYDVTFGNQLRDDAKGAQLIIDSVGSIQKGEAVTNPAAIDLMTDLCDAGLDINNIQL